MSDPQEPKSGAPTAALEEAPALGRAPERLRLPAIAIRTAVLFPIPTLSVPLTISRSRSLSALERAMHEDERVLILTQRDAREEDPGHEDLYRFGIVARVLELMKEGDDEQQLLIEGQSRARVVEYLETDEYLYAEVELVEDEVEEGPELEALVTHMRDLAKRVVQLSPRIPDAAVAIIDALKDPSHLCDLIASQLSAKLEEKQALIEERSLRARVRAVNKLLAHEHAVLEISGEIRSEVRESLEQHQREVFLREQLRAIQKQLGEEEEEGDELRERVLEAKMSEGAEQSALRELKRMARMSPQSSEYNVSRTYIDWLLDVPWSKTSEDRLDVTHAQAQLDARHYGLEKVKRRVVEFLAVCKLKGEVRGPILCLAGPPGVGKTSLAQSIADALGREFVRISLGGVRDEAEIRGHRRTYVGALPGRFIKALKRAGTMNPVVCLDEIDKLGSDFRGDPAAALLEVLDPEQNGAFSDHYLDVPVDLSKVLFVTTANRLDTIPPALKDRLEVLEIPGYLHEEKVQIVHSHLMPRALEEHGLKEEQVDLRPEAINRIIDDYTREAGVRNLTRQLGATLRSVAHDLAFELAAPPVVIDEARVRRALGPQKVFPEAAEPMDTPGVSIGLAWTPVGGEILFIEVISMRGSAKLTLTGQLGEVMKESAHTAMSLVHARAERLGIPEELFAERSVHLHLPSGAIPKDGPSAGVAITVALASLYLNKPMRDGVAMTGEITLRGRVLPVGGVKEKVLAAARAGMREVILPDKNAGDLEEIPAELRASLTFHLVSRVEEALKLCLGVEL